MKVVVQAGDTLQALALRHLGDAARWLEIVNANGLVWPFLDFSGAGFRPAAQPKEGRLVGQGDVLLFPDGPADTEAVADAVGTDLRPDGMRGLSRGEGNLSTALVRRLLTPLGYLPHRPEYGSELWRFVGVAVDVSTLLDLRLEVSRCLRQDPRVLDIPEISVWLEGDAVYVWSKVAWAGGELELETTLRKTT